MIWHLRWCYDPLSSVPFRYYWNLKTKMCFAVNMTAGSLIISHALRSTVRNFCTTGLEQKENTDFKNKLKQQDSCCDSFVPTKWKQPKKKTRRSIGKRNFFWSLWSFFFNHQLCYLFHRGEGLIDIKNIKIVYVKSKKGNLLIIWLETFDIT